VKGSEIPPQTDDAKFKMFTGKVVAQNSPKELLVNVDSPVGDATLQFETALKGTIEVGTEVKFKGVIDSFTKDPYMALRQRDRVPPPKRSSSFPSLKLNKRIRVLAWMRFFLAPAVSAPGIFQGLFFCRLLE
jgi:hypothetical protein